ncbi:hypothetical protein LOD99_15061 [Oopsacas minuta]|uniref:Uncharacterized protein n=1 Tax=Oopsacas minuta TaxID=111878 RepID=A0AAV7KC12_9METZ|nr:hypothetical protein LOD99_15061 [Oopsacas minuta]
MLQTVLCKTCAIWLEKTDKNLSAGNIPKPFSWILPIKNTRLSSCFVDSPCAMCQEAHCLGKRKLLDKFVGDDIVKRLDVSDDLYLELPRISGGHPVYLTDSSSLNKSASSSVPSVSLELSDMLQIKTKGNLSNNGLKSVISILRGKLIGTPGMKLFYTARYEIIGQFFEVCQLELNRSQKGYSAICPVWTVFCCDVPGLLSKRFYQSDGIDNYKFHYKLGLDFGQGFLKVTIQPELSNSVSDLAIIWLSPVPENYHNLKSIFSSHEIRRLILDFNISLTIDIKAALIAFGIMPGRHPCPWCTWDERDNLDNIGKWELRGSTQHAA